MGLIRHGQEVEGVLFNGTVIFNGHKEHGLESVLNVEETS